MYKEAELELFLLIVCVMSMIVGFILGRLWR